MIKLAFSFLFFLLTLSSYAQKIDSLYLSQLSKQIIFLKKSGKLDSALYKSKELLVKAKSINNQFFELDASNKLATYSKKLNYPFEAVHYYTKSQELYLTRGDTTRAINKLRHIASIQKILGDLNSSENTAIEALELANVLPDSLKSEPNLGLLNHLGITTKELKNYDDSRKWYSKALKFAIDSIDIIKIHNNIGVVDLKQGNYKNTLKRLVQFNGTRSIATNPIIEAKVLDNIAFAKSKLNLSEAGVELQLALECRKDIMDLSGQFASNIHLTEHYQDRNENKKALLYANQAYQLANTIKSQTSKIDALSYLIELKDNPQTEAIEFKRLTDSMYTARDKAKTQFARIKYETEQKERENLILKNENAQKALFLKEKETQNIIYLGLGILTILSSIFLFFYLRTKHRKEKILERHTTEKRLSKKLHDEVGNDVFYLMSQLQNQIDVYQNSNSSEIIRGLDTVYHKVRDFSRDHKIETGPEYEDELLSLLNSYGNQNTKVFTNTLDTDFWKTVADYKKVELYWVLKELLTNMKKHSQATIVSVSITKEKKNIMVKYSDNGIGTDLNTIRKRKNGLRNVENRIKEMKGTITFETEPQKGFKSIITFAP